MLTVYLEGYGTEIDNTPVENAIRPTIDPQTYLPAVLTRLPTMTNR